MKTSKFQRLSRKYMRSPTKTGKSISKGRRSKAQLLVKHLQRKRIFMKLFKGNMILMRKKMEIIELS